MRSMLNGHSPLPLHFSPLQHAKVWFGLAVVFFSLAAGSRYWNEAAQYHTYLAIGSVFTVLGLVPLLFQVFQTKSK